MAGRTSGPPVRGADTALPAILIEHRATTRAARMKEFLFMEFWVGRVGRVSTVTNRFSTRGEPGFRSSVQTSDAYTNPRDRELNLTRKILGDVCRRFSWYTMRLVYHPMTTTKKTRHCQTNLNSECTQMGSIDVTGRILA